MFAGRGWLFIFNNRLVDIFSKNLFSLPLSPCEIFASVTTWASFILKYIWKRIRGGWPYMVNLTWRCQTAPYMEVSDSSSGSKRSGFDAFLHLEGRWRWTPLRAFKPMAPSFRRNVLVVEPFRIRLFLTLCHGIQDLAANMAAIKNSADHTTWSARSLNLILKLLFVVLFAHKSSIWFYSVYIHNLAKDFIHIPAFGLWEWN